MRNFQETFETCKRSFYSAFSICMTVPLKNYGVTGNNLNWIQRPLLFLIHASDLPYASEKLEPSMFDDGTDVFYSYRNVQSFFKTANEDLGQTGKWLMFIEH